MTFESAFIFVITLILLWIKPGPGQAAIITRSLNDGFWPAMALAFGAMVGGAIFFVIAVLGISIIVDNVASIGFVLKLIGAGYMFYLGYQGLRDIESGRWTKRKDTISRTDLAKNFSTGLLIELSNPITIFYFIGLLPTLMPVADINAWGIALGVMLILYPGMVFYMIVITMAVQVKETLKSTRIVKRINLITSISFILIGAFFLFSALLSPDFSFSF
jgi:threonine/homoserine/homoserine lactone efflux protein